MAGDWGHSTPHERAAVLAHLATEYAKRAEDVATAQVLEMGCPISQVREVMVDPSIAALEYYSEVASTYEQEERRDSRGGIVSVVRRRPIGVVGAIVPWNGPNYLSMLKIGPAMVAGCATVLKPAPEAPLDLYLLAEAAIADIEKGHPIDRSRLFATGYSSGGFLVNVLACQRPGMLRAIASNAGGAPYNQREKWPNGYPRCPGQQPVAMLAVQRQNIQAAGDVVHRHVYLGAVDLGERRVGDDVGRRAVAHQRALVQQQQAVAVQGGDIEVVQDAHDRGRCKDENGTEPWACGDCDCTERLERKLESTGEAFLPTLRSRRRPKP